MERAGAGARIAEGLEKLVKTARKAVGKGLVVCHKSVKWWDEEAIRVRREAH